MDIKFGVNVFGYINGEFGLGEAVRLLIKAMEDANIPLALINYETVLTSEDKTFQNFSEKAPYFLNLVLLGINSSKEVIFHLNNNDFFKNKHNIFFLNWESENFPAEYVKNLSFYNEIWTPTKYCQDIVAKFCSIPVQIVHYPLEIKLLENIDIESENFYDKNKFNFLFMFDYNSSFERKNSLGLIEAFEMAFGKNNKDVFLTIKTSKSTRFFNEKKLLTDRISNFSNIKIVEKIFEKDTLHKIIKGCDSYISLHRSEGFGLTMAEAMYFEKPVIATGYSGNTEFMDNTNSFLVDFEIFKVDSDILNYDRNTIWSNPDVKHASILLKKVSENSNEVKFVAANGQKNIIQNFSMDKIGINIKEKLDNIFLNFKPSETHNFLIDTFLENEILLRELKYIKRSGLINFIMKIRYFFRDRKNARRLAKVN
jgi:glycosyltransferase involved in cell wall biosynthesis